MATELAKAYVQIVPSMEGVGTEIKKEFGSAGDEAGKSSGQKFGGSFNNIALSLLQKTNIGKLFGASFSETVVNFAKAAGKGMLSALTGAVKGIATSIGNGLKTLASGVVSLTKEAVAGYADYEQLVGGVETLFGAGGLTIQDYAKSVGKTVDEVEREYSQLMHAQNVVLANAANAYQTAGLSANEYMETVTSFAAALVSSLDGDTAAAAQYADMAITDMADNANKMGSSMESIQNAYQGFAKQNYTMLDNLKLGYGGTKEEMERLLEDAQKISGIEYDISSYADIVDAIHVIQTEMGITGTTAKEASQTISGSVGMLKASWQNLMVGLADGNADLGALIDNVVSSAETVLENVVPVVEQALIGIGSAVAQAAPIIAEKLPGLVEEVLPSLLEAATALINGLVEALPTILAVLVEQAPVIAETLVTAIVANIPQLVTAGLQLTGGIIQGIVNSIPALLSGIGQAMRALLDSVLNFFGIHSPSTVMSGIGTNLILGLINGVKNMISSAVSAVTSLWTNIKTAFTARISQATQWGRDLIGNFVSGIKAKFSALTEGIGSVTGWISSHLHFSEPDEGPLKDFHTWAPDMMMLFAQGIRDNVGLVTGAVNEVTAATMGSFRGLNGEIAVTAAGGNYTRSGVKGGTSITVPEINIYTQPGDDPQRIAEEVAYILGLQVREKGAVYA